MHVGCMMCAHRKSLLGRRWNTQTGIQICVGKKTATTPKPKIVSHATLPYFIPFLCSFIHN